jgi:hypothetical protein
VPLSETNKTTNSMVWDRERETNTLNFFWLGGGANFGRRIRLTTSLLLADCLTVLWASTAYYSDSFTSTVTVIYKQFRTCNKGIMQNINCHKLNWWSNTFFLLSILKIVRYTARNYCLLHVSFIFLWIHTHIGNYPYLGVKMSSSKAYVRA